MESVIIGTKSSQNSRYRIYVGYIYRNQRTHLAKQRLLQEPVFEFTELERHELKPVEIIKLYSVDQCFPASNVSTLIYVGSDRFTL